MRRIRKGDLVQVISGKYKGAKGRILVVLGDEDKVIVEGINIKKLHPRMLPGLSVFAAGQRVFADKVGPDVPGTVMLADVFNIIEGHHDATKD